MNHHDGGAVRAPATAIALKEALALKAEGKSMLDSGDGLNSVFFDNIDIHIGNYRHIYIYIYIYTCMNGHIFETYLANS